MTPIVGLGAIGAFVSVLIWTLAAMLFSHARRGGVLHAVSVYLTIMSLVGIDLLLLGAIARAISGEVGGLLFGMVMGVQVVAALSAVIFVRQARG